MGHVNRGAVGLVVVLLMMVPALGIDIQLPAMPDIGRDLDASVAEVQLTLSVYTVVFAVMQLLFGPLGDRFGRRRLLIGTMTLYALASLYCALAPSVGHLLVGRVLQALAACAGPVLARAVVRDLYEPVGASRVLGTVMAIFGIAALTVPLLGGHLVEWFGWRSTYGVAAGFGAAMAALVAALLPETLPTRDLGAAQIGRLAANYVVILRTPHFLVTVAVGCLIQAAMFSWIAGSSFAVVTILGASPSDYSLAYSVTVLGFVATSFLSGRLVARSGQRRLMALGALIAVAGGASGLLLNLAVAPTLATLIVPMLIVGIGHGLTFAQAMAGAMAAFPHLAGTASALFGFFQYVAATLVVLANGLLFDGTVYPMLGTTALCTMAAMLCLALFRRHLPQAG